MSETLYAIQFHFYNTGKVGHVNVSLIQIGADESDRIVICGNRYGGAAVVNDEMESYYNSKASDRIDSDVIFISESQYAEMLIEAHNVSNMNEKYQLLAGEVNFLDGWNCAEFAQRMYDIARPGDDGDLPGFFGPLNS